MTLCDAVNDFRGKITLNSRDTRYCTFAPPEETVGVIDLSADGDGSRGIAFLIDRMMIRLGADARQIYYRDIRVTEILPSYETPYEDELVIASPAGSIRISDCGLNKFFLRQLINTLCRMSNTMKEQDREALESRLTAEALSYYSGGVFALTPALTVKKLVLDIPQLPRQVNVVVMRILKSQHLTPHCVELLRAVPLYLLKRRFIVNQFSAAEYRHLKLPGSEIRELFLLPGEVRVEYRQRLRIVDSFIINAYLVGDSLSGLTTVKAVKLLEVRIRDLRHILGYLYFRGDNAVLLHRRKLVNSAEHRLGSTANWKRSSATAGPTPTAPRCWWIPTTC